MRTKKAFIIPGLSISGLALLFILASSLGTSALSFADLQNSPAAPVLPVINPEQLKARQLEQKSRGVIAHCSGPIRLKVGNSFFSIPRNGGALTTDALRRVPCDDATLETSSFAYLITAFLDKGGVVESEGWRDGFVIEFHVWRRQNIDEQDDTFTRFSLKSKLAEKGVKLSDLPLEDGFYTFKYSTIDRYFIAADEDMKTPSGNPVTFQCTRIHSRTTVMKCGTGFYWKDDLAAGVGQFTTNHIPKKEWRKTYKEFLKYLEGLETPYRD